MEISYDKQHTCIQRFEELYKIKRQQERVLPQVNVTLSLITFIGEVLLAIWVLVKSLRAKEWQDGALKPI